MESEAVRVEHALRDSGILGKLEAMTKASVVHALAHTSNNNSDLLPSNELRSVVGSSAGRTALSLCIDLLKYCGLEFTLSVLKDELGSHPIETDRNALRRIIGVEESPSNTPPLLYVIGEMEKEDKHPSHGSSSHGQSSGFKNPDISKHQASSFNPAPSEYMGVKNLSPIKRSVGDETTIAEEDVEDKYSSFSDDDGF